MFPRRPYWDQVPNLRSRSSLLRNGSHIVKRFTSVTNQLLRLELGILLGSSTVDHWQALKVAVLLSPNLRSSLDHIHCWGQAKCLELTVMNYNQLLNDIPLSSLPQLYKDAVYATRQLGQRYIWIDSLCIIQEGDDCKDWQTEVSLMSEVYSNSFCNIAAASASDCNHSMFSSRDRTPIEQETVSLVVNDREISSWYVFTSDRGLHDGREFWEKEVTNSLVNTRAWVVQERLLSARSLYFGPSQVYWQCDEKDAMEIWPAGIPDFVWGRRRNIKPDLKLTQGDSVIRQISDCRWQYIIQTYSTCDMTNPRDKLPAISAIAKRVRSITNDQYVVGMWLSILEQELLWSVDYECLKPRPKDYRAPSWSWAAVDGTVHSFCRNLRSEAFFTIEDWDIDYLTEDDTQQVKGGWLRLRGRLMEMTLMENTLYRNFKAFTSWVNGLQISYVRLDTIHDAFDQENADGSLYCLPTMVNKSEYYLSDKDERAHKAPPRLSFLVLQIVDREKGVFSRLGICENDFYRDEIDDLLGYREGEEDFPCEKYEDGYHHIRII
ncbi:hypothetical protein IFR05_000547 [Cadophora sp. M221]|nr:hypothetical protein IFR05_000547 [Cadophora sp. M221]